MHHFFRWIQALCHSKYIPDHCCRVPDRHFDPPGKPCRCSRLRLSRPGWWYPVPDKVLCIPEELGLFPIRFKHIPRRILQKLFSLFNHRRYVCYDKNHHFFFSDTTSMFELFPSCPATNITDDSYHIRCNTATEILRRKNRRRICNCQSAHTSGRIPTYI
jgi:hypothetical protein